jgi:hemerythrin-like domain-containing protein
MSCDPFEMALVHGGFRRELHSATRLVRGVVAGDRRRAAVVAGHIDFMMTAIHEHHESEDRVVWPKLAKKAPDRAEQINRMENSHRAIDVACQRVREVAVPWVQTGDASQAERLLPVIEGLADRVDEHFDDEEDTVVPLIAESLSPREWRRFLARGSAFVRTHPRRGLALGGIVLDGQPTEVRKRFLGNVPLPVRTIFNVIGDRVYEGYRTEIYGSTDQKIRPDNRS